MPSFFLGVDFIVLKHFSKFKSPHPPHKGSAVSMDIRLTQTCNCNCSAPPPPTHTHGNLRATRKCKIIVMNKVFESQGGGGGGVDILIFSSYVGSGPASTVHPKINIRNFKPPQKYSQFCTLALKKTLTCIEMTLLI